MANKPAKYTGITHSTAPFTLNFPSSGVTRVITKITVAYKVQVNPSTSYITTLKYGVYDVAKSSFNASSATINVNFENLYIVQPNGSSAVIVESTLPLSALYTAYITIECVEYDNVDDEDIEPFYASSQVDDGNSYTIPTPASNERIIIKQISLKNLSAFTGEFFLKTAESGGYGVASYYPITLGGSQIALLDQQAIVIDNNVSHDFTIDPQGNNSYSFVIFGMKITI